MMRKSCALFLVVSLTIGFLALGAVTASAQVHPCVPGNPFHPCEPEPCIPGNPFHPCPDTELVASCRASAVRVENLLGIDLEPFVANPQEVPCEDDNASLLSPGAIGPVGVGLLSTQTFADPDPPAPPTSGLAFAGAATVALIPLGISVFAAEAVAEADCAAQGGPLFFGGSVVVGVVTPGGNVLIPSGHQDIPIPLVGTLHLNETIVEPNRITIRAVWLESDLNPLVPDVIVGEAIADCEGAAPPPQTGP